MDEELNLSDSKIEELLNQFSSSREELVKYMADVDDIRSKVTEMFPANTTDYRNKFALEEKLKAMSSFYATLLSIRQEFNKTIKDEIELRRKIGSGDSAESGFDIRKIAEEVETQLSKKNSDEDQPPLEVVNCNQE